MNAFDLDKKLAADPGVSQRAAARAIITTSIASPSSSSGRFNVESLELFVQELSEKEKIYRSKGFLSIGGNPRRAIFHGVNNRFTLMWDRLWEKDEKRTSQLVFIGKHLDDARIRTQLEKCLAKN